MAPARHQSYRFGTVKLRKFFDSCTKAPMIVETAFPLSSGVGCADSPGVWLAALRFSCRRFSARKRLRGFALQATLLFHRKVGLVSYAPSRFCCPG